MEEYLIESGLQYAILQPSRFMDQFPIHKLISEEKPVYSARWDPEVPFSFTKLHDIGEAAAKILSQREKHYFATYEMVSTSPPMGWRQVCELVSRILGKEIKIEVMPFQQALDQRIEEMFGMELNDYIRDTAQRLLLYYNYRGLQGSSNAMRWLLEREPMQWDTWVKEKLEEPKRIPKA